MQHKAARWLAALVYGSVAVGGAWLLLRFGLPWLKPFLLAFSVAAVLEPAVLWLRRHGWRRSVASALLTLMVLGFLCWASAWLAIKTVSVATAFAGQAPGLVESAAALMRQLESRLSLYLASLPEEVAEYIGMALGALGDSLYTLPVVLSQWALDMLSHAAQASPDTLLFIVTAAIGSYLISASYPKTLAFLRAQLPLSFLQRLEGMGKDLKAGFGGMLRSQLILMAMTFAELLLAFWLIGVEKPMGLAAITALVDALPVFGTGIVLLPWAAYALLLGQTRRGIALVLCWLAVNLLRYLAQAKLLGDQIGLDPLASLLAVYVGWQVWGVAGMLLFPVGLAALCQLNERGVIRLWKNA